jgi:hypothetical protein
MHKLVELWEFLIYFSLLALMWAGAEAIFEGAVHSSYVDAGVCCVMARFAQRLGETHVSD